MVTDYDSWHADHGEVDIREIVKVMHENSAAARALVVEVAGELPARREPYADGSDSALEHAIITRPEARDPALLRKLDAVAGRVLNRQEA